MINFKLNIIVHKISPFLGSGANKSLHELRSYLVTLLLSRRGFTILNGKASASCLTAGNRNSISWDTKPEDNIAYLRKKDLVIKPLSLHLYLNQKLSAAQKSMKLDSTLSELRLCSHYGSAIFLNA